MCEVQAVGKIHVIGQAAGSAVAGASPMRRCRTRRRHPSARPCSWGSLAAPSRKVAETCSWPSLRSCMLALARSNRLRTLAVSGAAAFPGTTLGTPGRLRALGGAASLHLSTVSAQYSVGRLSTRSCGGHDTADIAQERQIARKVMQAAPRLRQGARGPASQTIGHLSYVLTFRGILPTDTPRLCCYVDCDEIGNRGWDQAWPQVGPARRA